MLANPHAIVEIDGQRWDSWELTGLFESVRVELPTNETAQTEIKLFDPSFRVIDRLATAKGVAQALVRVYLGYGENLGTPVFKGYLAHVERGVATTTLVVFDAGFKMKLLKRPGYHNRKDDLGILRGLAERNGLKFIGPAQPKKLEPHRAMTQDEQTDWEHALERARDAGLLLFVRQDTLFAKYPAQLAAPKLTLVNRKDFDLGNDWDFTYRTPESQDGRPRTVTVRGRGRGGKRLAGEDGKKGQRGREHVRLKRDTPGRHTKAKLSARARAQKELEREHSFEGRVRCLWPESGARPDVRDTVRVGSVGALFSRDYIIDAATYMYGPGELGMEFNLYGDLN